VTSLTGEKLYEGQAIEAVKDVAARHGVTAAFFVLVADEERSSYTLLVERDPESDSHLQEFATEVDHRLGELNLEYRSKRSSGRLAPLTVSWLEREAAEAYRTACVRAGQREGQLKPAVLQYARDLPMSFEPYVIR
jgi:hypothetical protein